MIASGPVGGAREKGTLPERALVRLVEEGTRRRGRWGSSRR